MRRPASWATGVLLLGFGAAARAWSPVAPADQGRVVLESFTFKAKISVLKALGNPFNAAHWETWTSPGILIQR